MPSVLNCFRVGSNILVAPIASGIGGLGTARGSLKNRNIQDTVCEAQKDVH